MPDATTLTYATGWVAGAITVTLPAVVARMAPIQATPIDWATITGLGCFALSIVIVTPVVARAHTKCASDQLAAAEKYRVANESTHAAAERGSDRVVLAIDSMRDRLIEILVDQHRGDRQ